MKLHISQNAYKQTNCSLDLSEDLTSVHAYSYNWWRFVDTDKVGNVIFNYTNYSSSTGSHQSLVHSQLRTLGIKVGVYLNHTRENISNPKQAIESEISGILAAISELQDEIDKPRSWKKTNIRRAASIQAYEYRIKDLQNYADNYIDKKRIPIKAVKLDPEDMAEGMTRYKKFFLKPNGKVQTNELKDFLENKDYFSSVYTSIDKLTALLDLRPDNKLALLNYRFTQDTDDMIPATDSKEYKQLVQWVIKNDITRKNLNALSLEKIHAYLTNKMNRKNHVPSEPRPLPVHPTIDKLRNVKSLKVIDTDRELRAEGRKQSHCIGGSDYIKQCLSGYQALNYKGYTFLLTPSLDISAAYGRFNSHTPDKVRSELLALIAA